MYIGSRRSANDVASSRENWVPERHRRLGLVQEALGRCKLQTTAAKGAKRARIRATTDIPAKDLRLECIGSAWGVAGGHLLLDPAGPFC